MVHLERDSEQLGAFKLIVETQIGASWFGLTRRS